METSKSPTEIALEYMDKFPESVERIQGDAFSTFWQYPEEVIKSYEATTNMLKVACQFTDEMIALYCVDYLADACEEIANLKAKEAQNS